MKRTEDMARGSLVAAVLLNSLQDLAAGVRRATGAPSGSPDVRGSDTVRWATPDTTGVPDGQIAAVDASIDWRARDVEGRFLRLESAAQRGHGADAWQVNDPTRPIARRRFEGQLGTGGVGAASAVVANGTPPTIASGSFAVVVDERATSAQRVYLYARPSDGALYLYNASGAALHGELFVAGSGAAGSPPAAGPGVPWRSTSPSGLGTLDDTVTTAVTLSPGAGSAVALDVTAVAVRRDGARSGCWRLLASFRGGSPPVQLGGETYLVADSNDGWGGASVAISGNDVVVQVQGAAATNVKWFVEVFATTVRA